MRLHRKRIIGIASALGLMLVGAAFAYHSIVGDGQHQPETNVEHALQLNPNGTELVVRAFTIGSNSVCSTHNFTGSLQPRYKSSVGFRVAGKIASRHIELGDQIKKGQILFRLFPEDFDLQLRVAEADQVSAKSLLTQTQAEESRLSQLRASGSVSLSDLDLAVASREVALARFNAADRRLEMTTNQRNYCDLVADSDGLVIALQAEAGQVVNIGQPVIQLMQNSELEAIVNLPEGMVSEVKDLQAQAVFWAKPGLVVQAKLRELSPVADPLSRTYDARFQLMEAASDLAIGMTVTIQLVDPKSQGTTVPLSAISSLSGAPVVWRIEANGHVESVSIEIVQYRNDSAIVRGSLQAGDQIVSAGVQRIDKEVTVRVWESKR